MRILKQRKQDRVDRRMALEGIPRMMPGVQLEDMSDRNLRVVMMIKRGNGFFERMRPPETRRSYDLDEFGTFVVQLVDGRRSVLDVVNEFEKRFRLSRREVELSVVAFFKLLMQRNVLAVGIPRHARGGASLAGVSTVLLAFCLGALGFAGPLRAEAQGAEGTMEAIRALAGRSRLPGSAGNLALEQWVAQRFADSGFEHGEMRFDAPVFEPGALALDCGQAGTFSLEPMHPALMRPGHFPQSTFESRLVYLGAGGSEDLERMKGVALDGAIAVMEYDSGNRWMDLLRFGIAGFVFVGDGNYFQEQTLAKVYNSEVAVPRYFIDGEAGARLRNLVMEHQAHPVKVQEEPSRWKSGELRNLWVLIPGADAQHAEKTIVFTAALDANAIVPGRAFGAQRAVNLHMLLKFLDDLRETQPLYSVLLVAVNGHTQKYAGERQLAWHLMAPQADVEEVRDEMATEMRLARLYSTEYGKLHLDPIDEIDKPDLHVMVEVLGQLDAKQDKAREAAFPRVLEEHERLMAEARDRGESVRALEEEALPERDEVLDLSGFTPADIREAIEAAEHEMVKAYSSFFANRGRDADEVEQEKLEDLALFAALRAMPSDAFMEKARRVKTAYDDEKLFEKWRGSMDQSTGRRIYIKSHLQDEMKRLVNMIGQDILVARSPEMSLLSEAERKERLADLNERRDMLRRVLVLFNKMDVGVGRSRTRYRQIAVNDVQREVLRAAVDKFVVLFTRWQDQFDASLQRDVACGAIRLAMGRRKVALVISLEMDGHAQHVGFAHDSPRQSGRWFNGFAEICEDVAEDLAVDTHHNRYVNALVAADSQGPGHFFNQKLTPLRPIPRSYVPDTAIWYYHSANQTPAFSMQSAFATPGRIFGPDDTVEQLDPLLVAPLQDWTRRFLGALVQHAELLAPANLQQPGRRFSLWSVMIRSYETEEFSGKPTPTTPVADCLVTLYQSARASHKKPSIINGDVINSYLGMTDDTASQFFYGLAEMLPLGPTVYKMDADFRKVLYTIDKGRVQSSRQMITRILRSIRATVPMFTCREFVLKERKDPTTVSAGAIDISEIWPKTAQGQSDPEKFGTHGIRTLSPAATHIATGPVGVYSYEKRAEFEQDALMIITGDRRTILNATEENPTGEGFQTQEELGSDIIRTAASDMAFLNKSRNEGMQGVVNQLLDHFLLRGDELIREAETRRAEADHTGYLRSIYEAMGNQVKAYSEIRKMNTDMLNAVIVYLALMLPFCFFLQKLLFNFKRLEHEFAGFSVLFFSMFVLFRFIHPAFRMAMSPEAIFIAFVLGAIGVFTTGVLRSRFNEEMTLLFRGVGGIGEEVTYGTVGTTAMLIGVQNMRRRRIRTTLTTATIILVVFTMLAFSSVSRTAKPTLVPRAASSPYTGLFYHGIQGAPFAEDIYKILHTLFSDRAEVRVRRILEPKDTWRLERSDNKENFLLIRAALGIPLQDRALRDSMALVEGEQFSSLDAEEILLSVAAADALGLGRADVGRASVTFLGRAWLLKGLIDDQKFRFARDLNPDLPLLPFSSDAKQAADDAETPESGIANISDQLIETAALVIIPEGIAAELGASPRSVAVIFPDMAEGAVAENFGLELRRVLDVTDAKFHIGSRTPFKLDRTDTVSVKEGIYYVGSSYRTAVGGLAKLLIPLLIAGSIILNTMLGTVYERKSEIAVFNAIGLNPTHIFMFFLAEAVVYSFIGAVGGYLIGQVLTIVLKGAGLITDMNINFSSLMVVYAILFTMALVILSTLYPGYVATRTAVPSGQRKWTMPDHDGNHMHVVFPFIYRSRLAYGVMYYLQKFFETMREQSLGDIVATLEEVKEDQDAQGKAVLSLRYLLALAPFDLGVTQTVTFTTQYDEVVKSFRLHMAVDRVSGRDLNWVTTNKPFLERMRKYLLRWRNIDPTRQAWFVNHAVAMFKSGEPPTVEVGKE